MPNLPRFDPALAVGEWYQLLNLPCSIVSPSTKAEVWQDLVAQLRIGIPYSWGVQLLLEHLLLNYLAPPSLRFIFLVDEGLRVVPQNRMLYLVARFKEAYNPSFLRRPLLNHPGRPIFRPLFSGSSRVLAHRPIIAITGWTPSAFAQAYTTQHEGPISLEQMVSYHLRDETGRVVSALEVPRIQELPVAKKKRRRRQKKKPGPLSINLVTVDDPGIEVLR